MHTSLAGLNETISCLPYMYKAALDVAAFNGHAVHVQPCREHRHGHSALFFALLPEWVQQNQLS
jgi:hypothetical protein